MPDYNRKATFYWWLVVICGGLILVHCAHQLAPMSDTVWLQIVLGTSMAMIAGLMPVRVAGSTNSFTAGEIFIFLLLLLHGPAAAAVASALEALVGACRTSKRWTSRIASPAMAAIAMFGTGSLLQAGLDLGAKDGLTADLLTLLGAIAFAIAYFMANTVLVTMVPRLKRNEPLRLRDFFGSFGWLGVAYAGNASVAAFLFLNMKQSGVVAVIAAVPIIAILLTSGHFFFRREEAAESVRKANDAKAEQAARHVLELESSERRFHSAFTHASIGMALVSFNGTILQANQSLRTLLGLPEADPHSLLLRSYLAPESIAILDAELERVRDGQRQVRGVELLCRHQNGSDVWMAIHCGSFAEPGSGEPCFILQMHDVSARRRAESELQHIAFHDNLTGLPNRHRFHEHLASAIEFASGNPGSRPFGVLFLDLDRFKLINDSMGHSAGDAFLQAAALRITRVVRPSDVVARLGGDEFAILARDGIDEAGLRELANRLQLALREPMHIDGVEISATASIGITMSSIGYQSPEEVLRDADTAMYKAKASGKARFEVFDVSLHAQVANRLVLEADLRRALAEEKLTIQYQPLIDMKSGALVGFEALARWHHPTLGHVSPALFIPVAEESGSIIQLTDFILRRACRQLAKWQARNPRFAELTMHVNVAGNDLASGNFVQRVSDAVMGARLRAGHLTIELTENILMERLEAAKMLLDQLHELGVGLSVDDFGTGYSSLSHLSNLPIDSLKIDRSFVENLAADSKEAAVIRAIVLLGHSLDKQVVAEGIETQDQLAQLRELGCDVAQGYLISRPLDEAAVDSFLDRLLRRSGEAATNVIDIRSRATFVG
ncbi:putative bifunctional diguanylate cyclase/phosphodiesterase [Piscinibacter sakaiensis]|uniref:putative bifunctional diguanylate cyclase/phosphodiesterase n=1 Tax=Piscinibacter sakaiensis TaxID=1547922 RepID=UPI003AB08080